MAEKVRLQNISAVMGAILLLAVMGVFSINFFVSYTTNNVLMAAIVSEEERSENEKEGEEKESATELEDVFLETRQYSRFTIESFKPVAVLPTNRVYRSFYSLVTTPPPQRRR